MDNLLSKTQLESATFSIDGQRVHCRIGGEGPPIVLLHGNPDTSRIWDGVAHRLKSRYRCIAPDLPGFGDSGIDADRFDFSLSGMARWVDAVVEGLGLTEADNLVVHDFGGIFGMAWFVEHPDKVRSVAITNTLFQADYRWHVWARIWRTPGIVSSRCGCSASRRSGAHRPACR